MASAIQLNFSLRTSAHCKTVHLLGSWDNYSGQLPLSKDANKTGGWKGSFRFQGSTLKRGQRYWYYYIIDGFHVSHDPARPSVTEPTTGRKLNTLDIPASNSGASPPTQQSSRNSRRMSEVPKGRSLSPSQIKSPRPERAHASKALRFGALPGRVIEQLAARMAATSMSANDDSDDSSDTDSESDLPSLTSSRSNGSNTPSSVSSNASSCCTCERYGITRAGSRVKLDCGGSRCGYSESSECSSESEDDYRRRTTRRQGIVVRH